MYSDAYPPIAPPRHLLENHELPSESRAPPPRGTQQHTAATIVASPLAAWCPLTCSDPSSHRWSSSFAARERWRTGTRARPFGVVAVAGPGVVGVPVAAAYLDLLYIGGLLHVGGREWVHFVAHNGMDTRDRWPLMKFSGSGMPRALQNTTRPPHSRPHQGDCLRGHAPFMEYDEHGAGRPMPGPPSYRRSVMRCLRDRSPLLRESLPKVDVHLWRRLD